MSNQSLIVLLTSGTVIGGGITFWIPNSSEVNARTIYLYNENGIADVLKIGESNVKTFPINFESLLKVGKKRWEHQSERYNSNINSNTTWRIIGKDSKQSSHWKSMHKSAFTENNSNFRGSIKFYLSGYECQTLKEKVLKNFNQEVPKQTEKEKNLFICESVKKK
ncbi:hypothetical protein [Mycoplasma parvum]|uniref:Uncharacterized protein n=1 Tax=Mycoplasma parvum str. Indiana TaxID=1403316 RepID=U5NGB0_9MOLU|nr:hypothetical protein [Mycoplasma parvum]AGX89239.1 hypothetical protein PRV_02515 [Mycoplasma parvum str. Indiana]